MSEDTNIAWADHTASPWFGCSKVSAGCTNCYAEELTLRNKWAGWGDKAPRVRSKGFWKDAYRWNRQTEGKANRPRMFTSLMDWLDPMVPIGWLEDFLNVIHECQNLDWLLLTKRPELWRNRFLDMRKAYLAETDWGGWIGQWLQGSAPTNIWFGVTVENQEMAEKRVPMLLSIPAKVRWLSVEPLLESVDLCGVWQNKDRTSSGDTMLENLDWIVLGGESGPKRRDCGVEAIVNVAEQCKVAGVPVFIKQDCALRPGQQGRIPPEVWALKEFPSANHT